MLSALLGNLLLTTALAILLAAMGRLPWLSRRPALRHWLWLLLLAKLVTPPLIAVPLLPAFTRSRDAAAMGVPASAPPGGSPFVLRRDTQANGDAGHAASSLIGATTSRDASDVAAGEFPSRTLLPYLHGLLAVSLLGTCLLLAVHVRHAAKLSRWLNRSGAESSLLAETCSDVASRMGIRQSVRSRIVDARVVPLLWGWRRPMVVVPRRLVEALGRQQLQSIVAHELAHFARRDHWANAFALAVKALMWWNPVAWWAHREMRAAQELCCDAIAIDHTETGRRAYATTLLTALDFLQAEPLASRELALQMGFRRAILRRFEMIASARLSYRLPRGTLAILLICGIPLLCLSVSSPAEEPPAAAPARRDADAAAEPLHTRNEAAAEASDKKPLAVSRPDRLYLVGTACQGGPADEQTWTAWLYDFGEEEKTFLSEAAALRIKDTPASVEKIEKHAVLLKVHDRLLTWKLGMSLAAVLDGPGEEGERPFEQKPAQILQAYRLRAIDPETVLLVLKTMMAQRPDMRMTVDPKTSLLIVLAAENDQATVRVILAALEQFEPLQRSPTERQEAEPKPGQEPKLRFAFRHQNWDDVLEWFAEQAGLSLAADHSIPGVFHYVDEKECSLTEAMDVLNNVLLTRGYALVRHGRALLVLSAAEGIAPDLVPRVTMEDLGRYGKFEFVSIAFPLGRRDTETVRAEIRPLLSRLGRVVVLPEAGQMLVTERAGLMPLIRATLQGIPEAEP